MKPSRKRIRHVLLDAVEDLTGKRFGKWLVLKYVGKKRGNRFWLCCCECGTEKDVCQSNLTKKRSTRCRRCARASNRNPHKKLAEVWRRLKRYGVLPTEWQDFEEFLKTVGDPPAASARLARYDISMPHGPANTFWMTNKSAPKVLRERQKLRRQFVLKNDVLLKIHSAKTNEERRQFIIEARKAGYTYELIGTAAAMTHQRVQQIVAKYAK